MPAAFLFSPFLAIFIFAVLACTAGWLAAKPVHAAALLLGLVVLDALHLPVAVNVGLSLYPEDLFFLILSTACLIRFCLFARLKAVPLAWWLLGMIQLGLLIWGVKAFGTAAGVEVRGHFYLWISVLFFATVRWSDRMVSRVLDWWIACAACLGLLAVYRWVYSAIDPRYAAEIMAFDPTGVRFRVISSTATLVIAIASLVLSFRILRGKLPMVLWPLLPFQLATIAILQHRSVWVSLFVGIACLLLTKSGPGQRLRAAAAFGMLLVPLVVALALPADNSVVASVKQSADHAVSLEEGTMVARVGFWDALMKKWLGSGSATTYLVGQPYGGGFDPIELDDGNLQDMVPHNHFVHILYRGGTIGLLATLWLFGSAWHAALVRTRRAEQYWAPFFLAGLSALFAYCIPYWAEYNGGMLLGIAIAYLRSEKHAQVWVAPPRVAARFASPRLPARFRPPQGVSATQPVTVERRA
jgi:hypothetical protein